MNESIFRKKSLERIASPDQLDDYLKVSSPSVWLVLAALLLALAAAGAWCFFGSIPTTADGVGLYLGKDAVCFVAVQDSFSIQPGMPVRISPSGTENTVAGLVEAVGEPVPAARAAEDAGAGWLAGSLPGEWVCPVTVRLKDEVPSTGILCGARVVLDERRPIDLLLGR